MSIDVNVTNDLVIVTESSEDITVNVSNAQGPVGPAGQGVPVGGTTGQVLKKLSNTNYDTYWALDGGGVPYSGATGDVDLGEYELKAGQVEFDQSPTGTAGVGVMRWNDTDGTVDLGLKGGNVTLQLGQELVQRVVNKSGANLLESAYQVVKVTDAQGQRLAVDLAQGNNDANSTDTLGIVTETINNNQEGFITTSGIVRNINTTGSLQGETWADGDVLYLSPTTAGAITNIKPIAPNHTVVLGYVVYAHANNGKIFTKCDNGYEIGELHDCYLPSPSNNDGIFWNSTNLRYENNTISGALGYTPVNPTRSIATTSPLTGGGDLSADRTLSIPAATTSVNGYLTSTDWNTFNNKQASLTLTTTGTSGAATLVGATLNIPQYSGGGGSMAIGGSITSATAGSVLFAGTSGVLAQDNGNLFWDDANNRLGIGTNNPSKRLQVSGDTLVENSYNGATILTISNSNAGNDSSANLILSSDASSGSSQVFKYASGRSSYKFITASDFGHYNGTAGGDISFLNDYGSGKIKFAGGGASTAQMTLTAAGRLLLGTTTESTYLLDVNGTARVSGQFKNDTTSWATIGGIAIGQGVNGNATVGNNNIAIGNSANTGTGSQSIAIGASAYSNGNYQLVFGGNGAGDTGRIVDVYFGNGIEYSANASVPNVTLNATGGVGTDKQGKNITIAGGKGTGAGTSGDVIFSTATTTTSGTTLQSLTERVRIYGTTGNVELSGVLLEKITTNRQTASYSVVLTDRGKLVEMNVATANNLTVPLNSSIAFPVGTKIDIAQYGAGQTTVVATSGVTIRSAGGALKLTSQYSGATLVKIGTDEWYLFGNITT